MLKAFTHETKVTPQFHTKHKLKPLIYFDHSNEELQLLGINCLAT